MQEIDEGGSRGAKFTCLGLGIWLVPVPVQVAYPLDLWCGWSSNLVALYYIISYHIPPDPWHAFNSFFSIDPFSFHLPLPPGLNFLMMIWQISQILLPRVRAYFTFYLYTPFCCTITFLIFPNAWMFYPN